MKGSHHLILSIIFIFPVIVLLVDLLHWSYAFVPLMVIMALLGSLLPDVDANEAYIFHGYYRPIGLFFKYGIYLPLAYFIAEDKHRGFWHSIEGLFVTVAVGTLMSSIFVVVINELLIKSYVPAYYLGLSHFLEILVAIALGLGSGFVLHLYEDSLSYSGITWLYHYNKGEMKGNFKVGSRQETFVYLGLVVVSLLGNILPFFTLKMIGSELTIIAIVLIFFLTSRIFNRILSVV